MKIHLTVILKSKKDDVATLRAALLDLVKKSTQEKACLQYDLHQNKDDETVFILHETWEDEQGLALHNDQVYLKYFFEDCKVLLDEKPTVFSTNHLA